MLLSLEDNIDLFNAEQGAIPDIDWDSGDFYAKILIGGIGLERGYTIKGLTVSYVVRESGSDDTVYQRARFFGYHKSYIGFVRMYLPDYLISNFEDKVKGSIIVSKNPSQLRKLRWGATENVNPKVLFKARRQLPRLRG